MPAWEAGRRIRFDRQRRHFLGPARAPEQRDSESALEEAKLVLAKLVVLPRLFDPKPRRTLMN